MGLNKATGQVIFILILAIVSFAILHENDQTSTFTQTAKQNQNEKPSAFIKGGQFTIYDKDGLATFLTSKQALYFSNPKRIEINNPSISFATKTGETITLKANTGIFTPEDELLLLKGNVIIQQLSPSEASPKSDNWVLQSEEFTLNNKTHFISTDQAVTMKQGQNIIKAVGLNAKIDEKKIELLSNVRGRYVFN